MIVSDKINPRGVFGFVLKDASGNIIERYEDNNIIVNLGRYAMAHLIGESGNNFYIDKIAFGTGTAPADPSDTAITSPVAKSLDSVTYPTINSVQFNWSLSENELNGVNISEFGLISNNGNLFAKKVRTAPIAKDNDFILSGYWRIIF